MSEENRKMFSRIAPNYDRVNRILSMRTDVRWRKSAARECLLGSGSLRVLDSATGTGDIAIILSEMARNIDRNIEVVGLDFTRKMLEIARQKAGRKGIRNIRFIEGNSLHTGLKGGYFDVVTSGFALRNFDSLKKFMDESYRVLKPGGKIVLLEMAKPEPALRPLFELYYRTVIPLVGGMYDGGAYEWLLKSIWRFDKVAAARIAKESGFRDVRIVNLTFGAAFLLIGHKPDGRGSR